MLCRYLKFRREKGRGMVCFKKKSQSASALQRDSGTRGSCSNVPNVRAIGPIVLKVSVCQSATTKSNILFDLFKFDKIIHRL